MAVRARLVAPPPPIETTWLWHKVEAGTVPASLLFRGDRRMEAETYLTSGFGLRAALEARKQSCLLFGAIADAWAPPRIKQVLVDPKFGAPYLNTSQIFDIRPTPRKWLAMGKTTAAERRLVVQGTILVMASASPGRATITTKAQEGCVVSHHFMRVEPKDPAMKGWLYAFLKSAQGFAMMSGSQYASIIRHIEPHHLAVLPVPNIDPESAAAFSGQVDRLVELRNEAHDLTLEAEALFAGELGDVRPKANERGYHMPASKMFSGRRRFDGAFYTPVAAAIFAKFKRWEPLKDVTQRVWWLNRFSRVYGAAGLPYMSAAELFSIDPQMTKRILVSPKDNHEDCFVKKGWILMARSGQVYGLNGAARLATEHHERVLFSDDFIRIVVDEAKIRPGYLLIALTHPTHGRPLLIRAAYGTSIPHLDPGDVAEFPVVRLDDAVEAKIASLAERAAKARSDADALDREIALDATTLIGAVLRGATVEDLHDAVVANARLREVEAHPERLIRGNALESRLEGLSS